MLILAEQLQGTWIDGVVGCIALLAVIWIANKIAKWMGA